jgi:sirohydrochlorin ferrochelatase
MVRRLGPSPVPVPSSAAELPFEPDPGTLPAPGHADRWSWLLALRRQGPLVLEPWLRAIEVGQLAPESDLLAVLADQLDADAAMRLLRFWWQSPGRTPALPNLVGRVRDRAVADLLGELLAGGGEGRADPACQALLLPLLGYQRQARDFLLLQRLALQPGPRQVRQAALEGLSLGLSAWPMPALRSTLITLARDLDPLLAGAAVDALARLPDARSPLILLSRSSLEASVAERLQRRLRGLPASTLLLLVHGRADGVIPPDFRSLAAELERRRGAPVRLRALTDPSPLAPEPLGDPLALIPLFLLPGGHVRHDVSAMATALRRQGPVRVLPFLGAWPFWQRALASEVAEGAGDGWRPRLLHHPIAGPLAVRYLAHLERVTGATCIQTPMSHGDLATLAGDHRGGLIPLSLGSSRLSESLAPLLGEAAAAPLLARTALREGLLQALEVLP